MLTTEERDRIILAPPRGIKGTVIVAVKFKGGDRENSDHYELTFNGVYAAQKGDLVCLGGPGSGPGGNPSRRYVLTFKAIARGNALRDASLVDPGGGGFDFEAGVIANPDDACGDWEIADDEDEFECPTLIGESIQLVNRKRNSGNALGYRFTVWATHRDGQVVPLRFDPRIINR